VHVASTSIIDFVKALLASFVGAAFFFVIVGVFGLPASVAGLALFAIAAILLCRRPQAGETV
jgi:hypothetical protein